MGLFDNIKHLFNKKSSSNKSNKDEFKKNIENVQSDKKSVNDNVNFKSHLKKNELLEQSLHDVSTTDLDVSESNESLHDVSANDLDISESNELVNNESNNLVFTEITEKQKLDKSLDKTREGFFNKMKMFFSGKNKIDAEFLDQLEEMLIVADIGVDTTIKIIELVELHVAEKKYLNNDELKGILKQKIIELLSVNNDKLEMSKNHDKPYVILFVGVNGVGKTTTIAKLANYLKKKNKKVLIGAADTFRAAAIDQLNLWAQKIDVPIIKQDMGADPASVAYDTMQSAISSNYDYVLIDTAGRLHNKVNLMNELEKINKSINKLLPNAPHEVVLALDASTGQNALEQAKQFLKSTNVTHLALTKLDGTAKGGVIISICDQLKIPIKYIGVGEKIDDIQLFNQTQFVESLFN